MNDVREKAMRICDILYEKKALDILAIHVGDKTVIADWFVIASGRAVPQNKALSDALEEKSAELGWTIRRREGYGDGRWIVLDYGDILVHLFHPEERKYYNMERLWDEDNQAVNYSREQDEKAREQRKAEDPQA